MPRPKCLPFTLNALRSTLNAKLFRRRKPVPLPKLPLDLPLLAKNVTDK
jgi:hypothetical protein